MEKRDIMVIGTSAGGFEALKTLVADLPADLPAAVFIVWHLSPQSLNLLPMELSRAGPLPATNAADGEEIRLSHIYVAPADHHVILEKNRMRLTHGPKENRFRPAIDPLFRSAAYYYGSRVVGAILTGSLDDGTAGLWEIKNRGGIAIVQDPREAQYPSMPHSALRNVKTDYCVPLKQLAPLMVQLSLESIPGVSKIPLSRELTAEVKVGQEENAEQSGILDMGKLTPYTCPECHGTLVQMKTGGVPRFRCHTGHAYSIQSLLAELSTSMENTMWNAIRALEEGSLLMKHMSEHAKDSGDPEVAHAFLHQAEEAHRRAEAIRRNTVDAKS